MAEARKLITWTVPAPGRVRGTAGGIDLFSISYRTQKSQPRWTLRTELPGVYTNARSDDRGELEAEAEEILAGWLAKVSGGA